MTIDRPNISTEHKPTGGAARPGDTLDRTPSRDPESGAPVPDDVEPETSKRDVADDAGAAKTRASSQQ